MNLPEVAARRGYRISEWQQSLGGSEEGGSPAGWFCRIYTQANAGFYANVIFLTIADVEANPSPEALAQIAEVQFDIACMSLDLVIKRERWLTFPRLLLKWLRLELPYGRLKSLYREWQYRKFEAAQ